MILYKDFFTILKLYKTAFLQLRVLLKLKSPIKIHVALNYLEKQGILRVNGTTGPKKYEIIPKETIDINQFVNQLKNKEIK